MLSSEKMYDAVHAAWRAYSAKSTPAVLATAREVMKDSVSPASALFIAARHLLGPAFTSWEPESLWAHLDIADHNRDKLLAAITNVVNPAFYWDPRVFATTCEIFNDGVTSVDVLARPDVDEIAWAVFEAELLHAVTDPEGESPEFDDPVEAFVAAAAHDHGRVLLPDTLSFSERHLLKLLNEDARAVYAKAKETVSKQPREAAGRYRPDGTPEGVQVGRLLDAAAHVNERAAFLTACLRQFQP
jgi:hypothetical protein